ncbi:hypothetical protein BEL01nite_57250 [Bradyrhizobium elkanii]|nr:hypothetical protein BEL01nite_57250 [Bradyrhizobium elkanii]
MHRTTGAHNPAAENAPNTLVPKTDAENWDVARKFADNRCGYPGLHWCAGAGRDDDRPWLERNKIGAADRVIPDNFGFCTKLAEVARNIENEGVVIVDDEDQNTPDGSALKASNSRWALASVSSYSASGSDIAVIPPPA